MSNFSPRRCAAHFWYLANKNKKNSNITANPHNNTHITGGQQTSDQYINSQACNQQRVAPRLSLPFTIATVALLTIAPPLGNDGAGEYGIGYSMAYARTYPSTPPHGYCSPIHRHKPRIKPVRKAVIKPVTKPVAKPAATSVVAPLVKELTPQDFIDTTPAPAAQASDVRVGLFYVRPNGGMIIGTGGFGWGAGAAIGYQCLRQTPHYQNEPGQLHGDNNIAPRPAPVRNQQYMQNAYPRYMQNTNQNYITMSNQHHEKPAKQNNRQAVEQAGWQIEIGVAYQQTQNSRTDKAGDENFFVHFVGDNDSGLGTLEMLFPQFRRALSNPTEPLPFTYTFNGVTDSGSKTVLFFARDGKAVFPHFDGLPEQANRLDEFSYVVQDDKFVLVRSNDPSRTPIDMATLVPDILRGALDGYDKVHFEIGSKTQQQLVPMTINIGYRLPLDNKHGFYFTPRLGAGVLFNRLKIDANLSRFYQNSSVYDYTLPTMQHTQEQWAALLAFSGNLDYQLTPHVAVSLGAGINYVPTGYITTPSLEQFTRLIKDHQKDVDTVASPTAEAFFTQSTEQNDLFPITKERRSYIYGAVNLGLQFSF